MTTNEYQKEITITNELSINAHPNKVFSLVCPIMEYKWIKGWKCN